MPEGVNRLIEAWRTLRRDLDRRGSHRWGPPQLARAANLAGVRHLDAHGTRIGDLSSAIWGEFHELAANEGATSTSRAAASGPALRCWSWTTPGSPSWRRIGPCSTSIGSSKIASRRRPARGSTISKPASLAKRYEADSDRGFYKALKEFRQIEAEAPTRIEATPDLPTPDLPGSRMISFCGATPPADRELALAFLDAPMTENPVVRGPERLPLDLTQPLPPSA